MLVLIITFSAFFILLLSKLGLRDKIVLKAPLFISKAFDCGFCLSFWTSTAVTLFAFAFGGVGYPDVLVYPIMATPIIRILI